MKLDTWNHLKSSLEAIKTGQTPIPEELRDLVYTGLYTCQRCEKRNAELIGVKRGAYLVYMCLKCCIAVLDVDLEYRL
jgi:hypothetical protein